MEALEWADYICPWCYLGLDRVALLEELDVRVTWLPFELHPETPAGGYPVRADGRLAERLSGIGEECVEAGLPFRMPAKMPNSRRALETAEWVRRQAPDSFPPLHRALFEAHFAEGRDIGDADELDDLVRTAGADPTAARASVDRGESAPWVDESMGRAREHGVAGTPAWLLDDRLLIPGVQPRDTMQRWIERIRARADR